MRALFLGLSAALVTVVAHANILAKIAEENARLAKAIGSKCQVKLDGLEGRVKWERTDVAELTLYIPYGAEISGCVYEP